MSNSDNNRENNDKNKEIRNRVGNGCSGICLLLFFYFCSIFFIGMNNESYNVVLYSGVLSVVSLALSVIFLFGTECADLDEDDDNDDNHNDDTELLMEE